MSLFAGKPALPQAPSGSMSQPYRQGQFPTTIKPQAPRPNPVAVKPPMFAQATPQGMHQMAQQAMKAAGETVAEYDSTRYSVLYGLGGGEYGPDVAALMAKTAGEGVQSPVEATSAGKTLFSPASRSSSLAGSWWGSLTKRAANGVAAAASMPPQPGPSGAPMPPTGAAPTPAGGAMPMSGPTDPGGMPPMGSGPAPGMPMGAAPGQPPMGMPGGPPPPGTPGGNPVEAIPNLAQDLVSQGKEQRTTVGGAAKMQNLGLKERPGLNRGQPPLGGRQTHVGGLNQPASIGMTMGKTAGLNIEIEKSALFGQMGRALGRVGSGYKTRTLTPDQFIPKPRAPLPAQQPLYQQIQAVMQQRRQPYGPLGMGQFTGWNKLSADEVLSKYDVLAAESELLFKEAAGIPLDPEAVPIGHPEMNLGRTIHDGPPSFAGKPGQRFIGSGSGSGATTTSFHGMPSAAPRGSGTTKTFVPKGLGNMRGLGRAGLVGGSMAAGALLHRLMSKSGAHLGDLKGPIKATASGESEGLTFADAGPIRHGKDAWDDLSRYFKGHSSRKTQPDPFNGKHADDGWLKKLFPRHQENVEASSSSPNDGSDQPEDARMKSAAALSPGKLGTALKGVKDWVGGKTMQSVNTMPKANLPKFDAFGEEVQELGKQNLLRKLTRGLSDRPNFHVKDRLVGGAAGGAAGAAATNDQSTGTQAGATLAGALAGGKGLNATMNVGRKYVANTSPLFGYETKEVPRMTLRNLWKHGVKDVRANNPANNVHEAEFMVGKEPRYELLRRYLGIHQPNAAKDFFVKNKDGSLTYNPAVVKPGSTLHKELIEEPASVLNRNKTGDIPYSNWSSSNPFRNVFGSHDLRLRNVERGAEGTKTTRTIGDAWNFAIDPHEKPIIKNYLKGLAKTSPSRWGEYLKQPDALGHNAHDKTVGGVLGAAGMRQAMEKVLRKETPVVRANIESHYPRASWHDPTHKLAADLEKTAFGALLREGGKRALPWAGKFFASPGAKAVGTQFAPTAMGAAGGALTADSHGMNPWAGAAMGAAAFNPRLRGFAAQYAGKGGMMPVHAVRGAVGGNFAGSMVDQAAGAFGYGLDEQGNSKGTFARMGTMLGGGLGAGRGLGAGLAANPVTRAFGKPLAQYTGNAMQGITNFSQGTMAPMAGGLRRGLNWLSAGKLGKPTGFLGQMSGAASKTAPTAMGRIGQAVGGATLAGTGLGMATGYLDNKINQKAQQIGEAGLGALDEYADAKMQHFAQNAPRMIGQGLVNSVTDPMFNALGMNPAGMHPMQKAMMMGGGAMGAAGMATGNPWLMGGGALLGGGGAYMANQQNPLLQPQPNGQPPMQGPAYRNELAHQQQSNNPSGMTGQGWM